METWIIPTLVIVLYSIACAVLGYAGGRVGKVNMEEYFVGGRKIGFLVAYFTYVATFHSAFAILGAGGWIYARGVSFFAIFCSCIFSPLMIYLLGYRVWLLGKRYGYITPSDLLADFYKGNFIRVLVALVGLVFTLPYIQAQMMGSGYIFEVATGGRIPYFWGAFFLYIVMVVYIWMGGLRAVAWTDTLQGIWMFAAVWVGGFIILKNSLGTLDWGILFQKIEQTHPNLLTISSVYWPIYFSLFISLAGISIQPPSWLRFYIVRKPQFLKWMAVTSPLYLILFYFPIFLIGFAGKLMMPGIKNPDMIVPLMALKYMPIWLASFVFAGGMAAIMSTADSQLHVCSAIFTRDIYQKLISPEASEERSVFMGKILIVVFAAISVLLALTKPTFIVIVVAVGLGGLLQLLPALIGAIYWPRATRQGVIAGLIVGITVLILTQFVWPNPLKIMSGAWGILANAVVFIIVSYLTPPPSEESINRFHGYLESVIYKSNPETASLYE
jgi:SSS family solute:Na+ symporter